MMPNFFPRMMVISLATMTAFVVCAQTAHSPIHLRAGQYVQEDTPCLGAPFAAMRTWDGTALSDPHSSHCKTRVLGREGEIFTIENVCLANGDGSPAQLSKERLTLQVVTTQEFRLMMPGVSAWDKSASYRLCRSTQQ